MSSLVWGKAQQLRFNDEHEYYQALGSLCRGDCFSISYETNAETQSWSDAYRIKCYANDNEMTEAFRNAMRSGRRINCNDYVENLNKNHSFEFDYSNKTIKGEYDKVKATVPKQYVEDFINGYNLVFSKKELNAPGSGRKPEISVNNRNNESIESEDLLPEEIGPEIEKSIIEGAKKTITVNAYERDQKAKRICKDYYLNRDGKIICQICGFDFGKIYGSEFANKIHFHHIVPLSQIGEEYIINPTLDLLPVCPNCHFVLHAGNGLAVEELRNRLKAYMVLKDNKE